MRTLGNAVRAFPTLLRVGFADAVAYRAEFLIWVLVYAMPIIMLSLWWLGSKWVHFRVDDDARSARHAPKQLPKPCKEAAPGRLPLNMT